MRRGKGNPGAGGDRAGAKGSDGSVNAGPYNPNATRSLPLELIGDPIEVAKSKLPTLTVFGMGFYDFKQYRHITSGPEFEQARSQFSAARVATAIAFLRQCRPIKTPSLCSYGLKHAAESWGERNGLEAYVANGELIAAAVYLGLTLKPFEYDCPNVKIGISRKDVRRLRRR